MKTCLKTFWLLAFVALNPSISSAVTMHIMTCPAGGVNKDKLEIRYSQEDKKLNIYKSSPYITTPKELSVFGRLGERGVDERGVPKIAFVDKDYPGSAFAVIGLNTKFTAVKVPTFEYQPGYNIEFNHETGIRYEWGHCEKASDYEAFVKIMEKVPTKSKFAFSEYHDSLLALSCKPVNPKKDEYLANHVYRIYAPNAREKHSKVRAVVRDFEYGNEDHTIYMTSVALVLGKVIYSEEKLLPAGWGSDNSAFVLDRLPVKERNGKKVYSAEFPGPYIPAGVTGIKYECEERWSLKELFEKPILER